MEGDVQDRMVEAFKNENPYAARADYLLSLLPKESGRAVLAELTAEAAATATLALAYEQRQTRFDIESAIINHIEHWIRP